MASCMAFQLQESKVAASGVSTACPWEAATEPAQGQGREGALPHRGRLWQSTGVEAFLGKCSRCSGRKEACEQTTQDGHAR